MLGSSLKSEGRSVLGGMWYSWGSLLIISPQIYECLGAFFTCSVFIRSLMIPSIPLLTLLSSNLLVRQASQYRFLCSSGSGSSLTSGPSAYCEPHESQGRIKGWEGKARRSWDCAFAVRRRKFNSSNIFWISSFQGSTPFGSS